MEAEIRVRLPQAKKCLGPLEAGRGKEGCFLRVFRESMAYRHLDFGLLGCRMVGEYIFVVLSCTVCGHLSQ